MNLETIPRRIDISAVKTDVTINEVNLLIDVAKHFNFLCTFVMPCYTEYLVQQLKEEKNILVGGVVGFPSGAVTTNMKMESTKELVSMGVDEIDMVINVGALKSQSYDLVLEDIKTVVNTADHIPVKTILEVAYLTDEEIKRGSEIAVSAGAKYIKTGTGWANKPTTVHSIELIKETIGDAALIKAAGGIRDLNTIIDMIDKGCDRFGIGINTSITIMKEIYQRTNKVWDYK